VKKLDKLANPTNTYSIHNRGAIFDDVRNFHHENRDVCFDVY